MEQLVIDGARLEALIASASASGGAERANYQLFIERLCGALGLPGPDLAREENSLNDYVFERRIDFKHPDGTTTSGFIDCYRKNSFVLEAKQSRKRQKARLAADQLLLLPEDEQQFKSGHALRGTRSWDQVMLAARRQAEDYARALPVEHGYPPFLLVVDVGHVIEVYADFSGQGKNYAHFPDRQSYRISTDGLRDPEVQARLQAIWNAPRSLDPTRISAEVTRDIAERLAKIAKRLEEKYDAKDVAEFLMRCLFTMFAEDAKLIPEKGFHRLLGQMRDTPKHFVAALESLWAVMDQGGYAPYLNVTLKKFNGSLFKKRAALPLDREDINELWIAAGKDWSNVEPAIFGTLLERALNSRERSKLGAHYTPRAYVERLVVPTIIEPLRADWELVQGQVKELLDQGNHRGALATVLRFHRKLCTTRVLDPACGTGNFLYVSLELMKKLEGEVLEAISSLGGQPNRYSDFPEEAGKDLVGQRLARTGGRFTVDPHQFYGLELNPRAVVIADLVLWIGYLKWQLKTGGPDAIQEPVLDVYGTIKQQDAVIAYDRQELLRDTSGRPLSRWDGVTRKLHPITGEEIPDPDAQVPLYTYLHPKRAPWPEVEFIVGNPPFIGGKDMRGELGDGYAEACWAARPHIPGGADFVMHFWDEAAVLLLRNLDNGQGNPLRRFGFITTNSITQTFSRRVIEHHMAGKEQLSLVFAVPNHPWLKATDKAAVRIAMTVAERGEINGVSAQVVSETALNTDTPNVSLELRSGRVLSRLSLGANLSLARELLSNEGVAIKGFELGTQALLLENEMAAQLVKREPRARRFLFPYMNGNDFKNGRTWRQVIDTYPAGWNEIEALPELANYLLANVQMSRNPNTDDHVLEKWWQFRRTGEAIRAAVQGLPRFIATTRTSKHRFFGFLPAGYRPESKTVVVASEEAALLAVLSSRIHVEFAIRKGGRQGVGDDPVYQHTDTFNPFPFPMAVEVGAAKDQLARAQLDRLRELGERLNNFREERLSEHSFLTMTCLYNALEKLRELENGCDVPPLTEAERDVQQAGLIAVLKQMHDEIDRAVLVAYGWDDLVSKLVGKPGATVPSVHKSEAQESAEEELLSRLLALNLERMEEERHGRLHWLRPDYQAARFGVARPGVEEEHVGMFDIDLPDVADRPRWPADGLEQIRLVRDLLSRAPAPTVPDAIANALDGRNTAKRRERIAEVLETLVATGLARTGEHEGQRRYFLPR
jgi:hypothetical protein